MDAVVAKKAKAVVEPRRVVDCPNVAAYRHANVLIMLWRGPTTDEALEEVHRALGNHAMRHEEGIAIVSVIEPGATPPSAEHRARVREVQEQLGSRLRCLALVVDGMGFWASAVLGAATAIVSARRVRFPQRVCRTRDDAVAFVAFQLQGTSGGDANALRAAIDFARKDASARPSG